MIIFSFNKDLRHTYCFNSDDQHNKAELIKTKMKNIHEQASGLLQKKTEELIARFLKGREPDFLKQHARLLDDYFRQAFETSMVGPRMDIGKNPYTIIALGGYGREEQCIHSDVDLLFLFK